MDVDITHISGTFVCLYVRLRAVHLKAVSDMKTQAFLAAFSLFLVSTNLRKKSICIYTSCLVPIAQALD